MMSGEEEGPNPLTLMDLSQGDSERRTLESAGKTRRLEDWIDSFLDVTADAPSPPTISSSGLALLQSQQPPRSASGPELARVGRQNLMSFLLFTPYWYPLLPLARARP